MSDRERELERLVKAYRYDTVKHLYCTIRYDGTDHRCQICQHADKALEGKDG